MGSSCARRAGCAEHNGADDKNEEREGAHTTEKHDDHKDNDWQEEHEGEDGTISVSDEDWPSTCVPAIGHNRTRGAMRGETTSLPSLGDVPID